MRSPPIEKAATVRRAAVARRNCSSRRKGPKMT